MHPPAPPPCLRACIVVCMVGYAKFFIEEELVSAKLEVNIEEFCNVVQFQCMKTEGAWFCDFNKTSHSHIKECIPYGSHDMPCACVCYKANESTTI